MYLFFSDWSQFLPLLEARGIPHGGRIIKAYAVKQDPKITLKKPGLVVLESTTQPFTKDEVFDYGERGTYKGPKLEEEMQRLGLSAIASQTIRALFRFANAKENAFCQYAMSIQVEGRWFIDHPFGGLHGLDKAIEDPERRSRSIHLDIFTERSLTVLRRIIDFERPELLAKSIEVQRLINGRLFLEGAQGRTRGIERQ